MAESTTSQTPPAAHNRDDFPPQPPQEAHKTPSIRSISPGHKAQKLVAVVPARSSTLMFRSAPIPRISGRHQRIQRVGSAAALVSNPTQRPTNSARSAKNDVPAPSVQRTDAPRLDADSVTPATHDASVHVPPQHQAHSPLHATHNPLSEQVTADVSVDTSAQGVHTLSTSASPSPRISLTVAQVTQLQQQLEEFSVLTGKTLLRDTFSAILSGRGVAVIEHGADTSPTSSSEVGVRGEVGEPSSEPGSRASPFGSDDGAVADSQERINPSNEGHQLTCAAGERATFFTPAQRAQVQSQMNDFYVLTGRAIVLPGNDPRTSGARLHRGIEDVEQHGTGDESTQGPTLNSASGSVLSDTGSDVACQSGDGAEDSTKRNGKRKADDDGEDTTRDSKRPDTNDDAKFEQAREALLRGDAGPNDKGKNPFRQIRCLLDPPGDSVPDEEGRCGQVFADGAELIRHVYSPLIPTLGERPGHAMGRNKGNKSREGVATSGCTWGGACTSRAKMVDGNLGRHVAEIHGELSRAQSRYLLAVLPQKAGKSAPPASRKPRARRTRPQLQPQPRPALPVTAQDTVVFGDSAMANIPFSVMGDAFAHDAGFTPTTNGSITGAYTPNENHPPYTSMVTEASHFPDVGDYMQALAHNNVSLQSPTIDPQSTANSTPVNPEFTFQDIQSGVGISGDNPDPSFQYVFQGHDSMAYQQNSLPLPSSSNMNGASLNDNAWTIAPQNNIAGTYGVISGANTFDGVDLGSMQQTLALAANEYNSGNSSAGIAAIGSLQFASQNAASYRDDGTSYFDADQAINLGNTNTFTGPSIHNPPMEISESQFQFDWGAMDKLWPNFDPGA